MGMGILLLTGAMVASQPPESKVVYLNDRAFQIPVQFDEKQRPMIRDVTLFESADQGRQWSQRAVNPPSKDKFDINVPADGWYWYVISILYQDGQRQPSEPSKAPRIMKVLVDTKKPDVRLAAERQGDGVLVKWDIQEENPKLASLKLEYRTADMPAGQWAPVRIDEPKLVGQTGFRAVGNAAVTLRLQIEDLAENVGGNQAEVAAAPAQGGVAIPTSLPVAGTASDGGSGSPFSARPANRSLDDILSAPSTSIAAGPAIPPPHGGLPSAGAVAVTGPQGPPFAPSSVGTQTAPPRGPVPGLEYVNTNRVTLKYAVDKIGASGLGSVDLYVTRDDGATWQRLTGEQLTAGMPPDPGGAAPTERSITADLPGEGRYGFYLIVRSGVGLGKQPPRNGDRPQMRVEVDLTPPEGTLYGLQPVQGQTNAVVVRWKASDLNLAEKPIRLEWADHKGGPWTLVGEGDLPNTGFYTWRLPSNIPGKVYLKMTITDLAHNTGVAETPEPVTIDLTEPEARIIGLGLSR